MFLARLAFNAVAKLVASRKAPQPIIIDTNPHQGMKTAPASGISHFPAKIKPVVVNKVPTTSVVSQNNETVKDKIVQNQSFPDTIISIRRDIMSTDDGSIGELIDEKGVRVCYICEDRDRLPALLDDQSNFDEIAWLCNPDNPDVVKEWGRTRIPAGFYKVVVRYDRKRAIDERSRYFADGDWHNRGIMELVGVPGFTYIQFHPGNRPLDTHGCLLPGSWGGRSVLVGRSRVNYKPFYKKYSPIAEAGCLWVRITDGGAR